MGKVAVDVPGSWMVTIPGHPGPEAQHWVRGDAKTEPYVYGRAPYSLCRKLCIPADARYRRNIPLCEFCRRAAPQASEPTKES